MAKGLLKYLLALLAVAFMATACGSDNAGKEQEQEKEELDVKELIFHHLGDGYGWEVPFMHEYRIPLPVIVRAKDGSWHMFSSDKLTDFVVLEETSGKVVKELLPVPYTVEKNGKTYTFVLSQGGNHPGKVVEIFPLEAGEINSAREAISKEANEKKIPVVNGEPTDIVYGSDYFYLPSNKWDGVKGGYYRDYKCFDFSITKNVLALIIASVIVALMLLSLARFYNKNGDRKSVV